MKSIIGEYKEKRTLGQKIKQNLKSIKYTPEYIKVGTKKINSGIHGFVKTSKSISRNFSPSSRVTHSSMGRRIMETQREAEHKQKLFRR